MILVIKISQEFEPLLSFLFPDYSIIDNPSTLVSNKFIKHYNVTSLKEKSLLNASPNSGIIISESIYNEIWDVAKLQELCLNFVKTRFKSRKKTCGAKTFDEFIDFMFIQDETSVEDDFLFKSFGSQKFFIDFLSEPIPQIAIQSTITFISHIRESDSLYFKKLRATVGKSINSNMDHALSVLALNSMDKFGFQFLNFINLLIPTIK